MNDEIEQRGKELIALIKKQAECETVGVKKEGWEPPVADVVRDICWDMLRAAKADSYFRCMLCQN